MKSKPRSAGKTKSAQTVCKRVVTKIVTSEVWTLQQCITWATLSVTKDCKASIVTTHGEIVVPKLFPKKGPNGTYSHFWMSLAEMCRSRIALIALNGVYGEVGHHPVNWRWFSCHSQWFKFLPLQSFMITIPKMCSAHLSTGMGSPRLLPGPTKKAVSSSMSSSLHGAKTGGLPEKEKVATQPRDWFHAETQCWCRVEGLLVCSSVQKELNLRMSVKLLGTISWLWQWAKALTVIRARLTYRPSDWGAWHHHRGSSTMISHRNMLPARRRKQIASIVDFMHWKNRRLLEVKLSWQILCCSDVPVWHQRILFAPEHDAHVCGVVYRWIEVSVVACKRKNNLMYFQRQQIKNVFVALRTPECVRGCQGPTSLHCLCIKDIMNMSAENLIYWFCRADIPPKTNLWRTESKYGQTREHKRLVSKTEPTNIGWKMHNGLILRNKRAAK